jgi:hypothetical protein
MTRPSLDLAARQVVVASYLYYRHDQSMMSDGEFDALCRRLSRNFKLLQPIRRFQLRSAEGIASSGFGVRVTVLAERAAYAWMRTNGFEPSDAGPIRKWTWSDNHNLHWASINK